MIRAMHKVDAQALLDIYNHYVSNTVITFDIEPLSLETFSEKITRINKDFPFLIYEVNNEILGFAYASKFRPKPAYKHTVESTVYVKHTAHGKQIGTKLYQTLIAFLKKTDAHTILGIITIPNTVSEKFHEKFGFTKVSHLREVGLKFDKWHDIGIWQLQLT